MSALLKTRHVATVAAVVFIAFVTWIVGGLVVRAAIPAVLRHQGDEAYYEPTPDRVTMPPAHLFSGFDHYYATLAHELSHWSGHSSRLGRDLKNRFGTAAYAAEELVALSGQSAPFLTHH